jgi:hypothetical protein
MTSIAPSRKSVTGTTPRLVGSVRLQAGTYNVGVFLGSPGAVSTATLVVRQSGNATNLLTFTSSLDPQRLAAQDLVLASDSDVEFYVYNSTNSVGEAYASEITVNRAPLQLWANNISVRLGGPVAIDATAIELASGAGGQIGLSPTGGEYFLVSLVSGTNLEVVRCTARSTDTLTVIRAQEGTSARAWQVSGTNVVLAATSATLSALQAGL